MDKGANNLTLKSSQLKGRASAIVGHNGAADKALIYAMLDGHRNFFLLVIVKSM